MKRLSGLSALLILGASLPALAAVGTGYTLFGTAAYVSPGHNSNRAVKIEADVPSEFGGIDFGVDDDITVADLNSLGTDYFFPAGSTCGGGSPRFQINVDHDDDPSTPSKNIFVYIEPYPVNTGCPSETWTNTGNLIEPTDFVDASQIIPGGQIMTWAAVEAALGELTVTGIQLVSDTFGAPRTVIVDNTDVDGEIFTYEFDSKEDCKKGGWQDFTFAPGPFKNQGQCVSHFAKQK